MYSREPGPGDKAKKTKHKKDVQRILKGPKAITLPRRLPKTLPVTLLPETTLMHDDTMPYLAPTPDE